MSYQCCAEDQYPLTLFLMARPSGRVYELGTAIQNYINDRFELFPKGELPPLHMTVERITVESEAEIRRASQIIGPCVAEYSAFEMRVTGFSCFGSPHKSVNLRVERDRVLEALAIDLNERLMRAGFEVRDSIGDYEYHISLVNPNFALREWSESEYEEACMIVKDAETAVMWPVDELELWYPWYLPSLRIEAVYPLATGLR